MSLTRLFADGLHHYRNLNSFSQEELAETTGLDRSYISQLERAQKSPTLRTVERLADRLGISPTALLRQRAPSNTPAYPSDYTVCTATHITATVPGRDVLIPVHELTSAVNVAHSFIDQLYASDLDVASILGLRNLSAFVGEVVVHAIAKTSNGKFRLNPSQDGYPDLLLMDETGERAWSDVRGRAKEKEPFSPFAAGGIEVKATCGAIPSDADCRNRGIQRPGIGDTRIQLLTGYDWKAHHRETNNLVGVLWDFVDEHPRIAAMFFSSTLDEDDWGKIVGPKQGGGRTTSVSIMNVSGVRKMYQGWLCVLTNGGYREYLNHRNKKSVIPVGT